MSTHDEGRPTSRNVWMFMMATAMATTVSTLTATAIVGADSDRALEVTCDCQTTRCDSTPAPNALAPATEVPLAPEAPAPAPTPAAAPVPDQAATSQASDHSTSMTIDGSLDKEIVRRIVRAHIDEIRYCYNEGLTEDPELAGRVVIQLTLGEDGRASESKVASSDLSNDAVEECMANAMARWPFPAPKDGQKVVLSYPFVLEPG